MSLTVRKAVAIAIRYAHTTSSPGVSVLRKAPPPCATQTAAGHWQSLVQCGLPGGLCVILRDGLCAGPRCTAATPHPPWISHRERRASLGGRTHAAQEFPGFSTPGWARPMQVGPARAVARKGARDRPREALQSEQSAASRAPGAIKACLLPANVDGWVVRMPRWRWERSWSEIVDADGEIATASDIGWSSHPAGTPGSLPQ